MKVYPTMMLISFFENTVSFIDHKTQSYDQPVGYELKT
jgi:hypothetical protein